MKKICVDKSDELVVTLEEMKEQLRVTTDYEDAYITGLIRVAQSTLDGANGYLSRALLPQTWEIYLDKFPDHYKGIQLPLKPLISVEKVEYKNIGQEWLVIDSSNYELDKEKSSIYEAYNYFWDTPLDHFNVVKVTAQFGYKDVSAVDERIKHAIKLMVHDWYSFRGNVSTLTVKEMPQGAKFLLSDLKRDGFGC